MKTIGLIGGMSWQSTLLYYRHLNTLANERLGGFHSAPVLLYSVQFAEIEACQRAGDWTQAGERLAQAARSLEAGGAAFVMIGANTMHRVADAVAAAVRIPLLHVVDPVANAIRQARVSRVGLLGTRFTMEQTFYRDRLMNLGVRSILPEAAERADIHRIIFEELCQGKVLESSRQRYRDVMAGLARSGAEGIVLACTELELLVHPEDASVPLFDTTLIHARAAVDLALT